jgi:hypothetical protein
MYLLVSSQVSKQLRPILRAGTIIFRRKHCMRRFDIRQGAASFRPPKAREAPSYRLIPGRRKGVENRCKPWVIRTMSVAVGNHRHVRFAPLAAEALRQSSMSRSATSDRMRSNNCSYSIPSSARASSAGGTAIPCLRTDSEPRFFSHDIFLMWIGAAVPSAVVVLVWQCARLAGAGDRWQSPTMRDRAAIMPRRAG